MPTILKSLGDYGDDYRETLHEVCLYHFLHGRCYEFALALHQGLGWPIVGLMKDDIVWHACVRSPEGRLHDIRGYITEAEFGEPFLAPPYHLREVTPTDLSAIRPIDVFGIARARKIAEALWPELPWLNSLANRVQAFADGLEALCRQHSLWICGSPGSFQAVSPGDGSEDGYVLRPTIEGSGFTLECYFV